MHQVQSKYKNPDKNIRALKRRVDELIHQRTDGWRRVGEAKGRIIITWSEDNEVKEQKTVSHRSLGDFRVGDTVAIFGKVISVHETMCNEGNRESWIEYKLLTTRKML